MSLFLKVSIIHIFTCIKAYCNKFGPNVSGKMTKLKVLANDDDTLFYKITRDSELKVERIC